MSTTMGQHFENESNHTTNSMRRLHHVDYTGEVRRTAKCNTTSVGGSSSSTSTLERNHHSVDDNALFLKHRRRSISQEFSVISALSDDNNTAWQVEIATPFGAVEKMRSGSPTSTFGFGKQYSIASSINSDASSNDANDPCHNNSFNDNSARDNMPRRQQQQRRRSSLGGPVTELTIIPFSDGTTATIRSSVEQTSSDKGMEQSNKIVNDTTRKQYLKQFAELVDVAITVSDTTKEADSESLERSSSPTPSKEESLQATTVCNELDQTLRKGIKDLDFISPRKKGRRTHRRASLSWLDSSDHDASFSLAHTPSATGVNPDLRDFPDIPAKAADTHTSIREKLMTPIKSNCQQRRRSSLFGPATALQQLQSDFPGLKPPPIISTQSTDEAPNLQEETVSASNTQSQLQEICTTPLKAPRPRVSRRRSSLGAPISTDSISNDMGFMTSDHDNDSYWPSLHDGLNMPATIPAKYQTHRRSSISGAVPEEGMFTSMLDRDNIATSSVEQNQLGPIPVAAALPSNLGLEDSGPPIFDNGYFPDESQYHKKRSLVSKMRRRCSIGGSYTSSQPTKTSVPSINVPIEQPAKPHKTKRRNRRLSLGAPAGVEGYCNAAPESFQPNKESGVSNIGRSLRRGSIGGGIASTNEYGYEKQEEFPKPFSANRMLRRLSATGTGYTNASPATSTSFQSSVKDYGYEPHEPTQSLQVKASSANRMLRRLSATGTGYTNASAATSTSFQPSVKDYGYEPHEPKQSQKAKASSANRMLRRLSAGVGYSSATTTSPQSSVQDYGYKPHEPTQQQQVKASSANRMLRRLSATGVGYSSAPTTTSPQSSVKDYGYEPHEPTQQQQAKPLSRTSSQSSIKDYGYEPHEPALQQKQVKAFSANRIFRRLSAGMGYSGATTTTVATNNASPQSSIKDYGYEQHEPTQQQPVKPSSANRMLRRSSTGMGFQGASSSSVPANAVQVKPSAAGRMLRRSSTGMGCNPAASNSIINSIHGNSSKPSASMRSRRSSIGAIPQTADQPAFSMQSYGRMGRRSSMGSAAMGYSNSREFSLDGFSASVHSGDELPWMIPESPPIDGETVDMTPRLASRRPRRSSLDMTCESHQNISSHASRHNETRSSVYRRGSLSGSVSTHFNDLAQSSVHQKRTSFQLPQSSTLVVNSGVTGEAADFTINKLSFNPNLLYGREEAIEKLSHTFKRLVTPPSNRINSSSFNQSLQFITSRQSKDCNKSTIHELVMISGRSGTGKSALSKLLKKPVYRHKGIFMMGKFEYHRQVETRSTSLNSTQSAGNMQPYSGIGNAFRKLCDSIMVQHGKDLVAQEAEAYGYDDSVGKPKKRKWRFTLDEFRARMKEEVGSDVKLLDKVIPNLATVLGPGFDEDRRFSLQTLGDGKGERRTSLGRHMDIKEGKKQFDNAFLRFVRVISDIGHPLVMVYDDLQWADSASLDLLELMVSDRENPKPIMLIGCYRSNEVTSVHPLSSMIQRIEEANRGIVQEFYDDTSENNESLDDSMTNDNGEFGDDEDSSDDKSMGQELDLETLLKGKDKSSGGVSITTIETRDLNVEHVNRMLVDALSSNGERTQELADVVHKKTAGNVFFVIQFILNLANEELLKYNIYTLEWTWDVKEIEDSTAATENVIDLMKAKLRRLPARVYQTIPFIACFGSAFPRRLFEIIVDRYNESIEKEKAEQKEHCRDEFYYLPTDLDGAHTGDDHISSFPAYSPAESLDLCIEEGLFRRERAGLESYVWVHDKIREGALSLISPEELSSVLFRVGRLLLDQLHPDELDAVRFIAVNLLNEGGKITSNSNANDKARLIEIAELNMSAGIDAMDSSAFLSASNYFANGIGLLGPDHWQTNYELSLELYSGAAEAEYCVGNHQQAHIYCQEILAQNDRPLLDKERAYNIMVVSLGAQGNAKKALDLILDILNQLGCNIPKFGIGLNILTGLVKTKLALKHLTVEEISRLPPMSDERHIWVMALLDRAVPYAYATESPLLPLFILKSFRWSIRFGVSEFTAPTFASVGFLLTAFIGDLQGGKLYADYALAMQNHLQCREVEARTLSTAHVFVKHWTAPVHTCMRPLLNAYQVGLETGDLETAVWSIQHYLEFALFTGKPLKLIAADYEMYSNQMEEVKQVDALDICRIMWQSILNLTGASSEPLILTGDVMDEKEIMNLARDAKSPQIEALLYRMQLYVAAILGAHHRVIEIMKLTGSGYFERSAPGVVSQCSLAFLRAISCFDMAQQTKKRNHTKKRKYLRQAKAFAKKIENWVKEGNPNVVHYKPFLDAELAVFQGRKKSAVKHYEASIMMAGRRGMSHDQALGHERLGEYLLREKDTYGAEYHLSEAVKYFTEWGAHAKVEALRQKHPNMFLSGHLPEETL